MVDWPRRRSLAEARVAAVAAGSSEDMRLPAEVLAEEVALEIPMELSPSIQRCKSSVLDFQSLCLAPAYSAHFQIQHLDHNYSCLCSNLIASQI